MVASKASPARSVIGNIPAGLTGRGARLLLLDSGADFDSDWGGRLLNVGEDRRTPRSLDAGSHVHRIASVCADAASARGTDMPLGIAPEAQLFVAPYGPLLPGGYTAFLERFSAAYQVPHAVGHPYSLPDDYLLSTSGAADLVAAGDAFPGPGPLHVAAAGHDGAGRIRFPASAPSALSVGVCRADGTIDPRVGTGAALAKPELLVPDVHYAARTVNGEPAAIGGTSAAVAIVTGLAALAAERLMGSESAVSPALLRACLLSYSLPSASPPSRIAGPPGAPQVTAELPAAYGAVRLEIGLQASRIALVPRAGLLPSRWLPRQPAIRAELILASGQRLESAGPWIVFDLDEVARGTATLKVEASGPVASVALAGVGIENIKTLPTPCLRSAQRELVLALSLSHNESACLMVDGEIKAAVQLERLTGRKNDGAPFLHSREAADYCLHAVGASIADISCFAFNTQPLTPGYCGLSQPVADRGFDLFDPFGERTVYVSHHLAHAFSAYHVSGFDRATVFVADGSGGTAVGAADLLFDGPALRRYVGQEPRGRPVLHVTSTYRFAEDGFELLARETARSFNIRSGSSSLGETYAAASQYIFGDWHEGGKLMGLAPYGDAAAAGSSLLEGEAEKARFTSAWKLAHDRALGERRPMDERNLAARIQKDLEEALCARVAHAVAMGGSGDVAYSGGVALNSVANHLMRKLPGVGRLFVLPASNDAGIAIGAAAAARFLLTGRAKGVALKSDFLGYPYSQEDIAGAIAMRGGAVRTEAADPRRIATLLAKGEVIGWFDGGSEFGPRALGHRSILADPRRAATWHHINRRIKFREDFRPFAPAVMLERAGEFFELDGASPYMLEVVPVRPERRALLAAVTHVDGSARVQTVDGATNPRFHALLEAFALETGLPILLNTSLNVRGAPIAETPGDALDVLFSTHLDALVLGDVLVRPAATPGGIRPGSTPLLAPDVELRWNSVDGKGPRIVAPRRGTEVRLPTDEFMILVEADGRTALASLLERQAIGQARAAEILERFGALATLRLLHDTRFTAAR